MRALSFEYIKSSGEIEDYEAPKKEPVKQDSLMIEYSAKVTDMLKGMMGAHNNKANPDAKTSLSELKKVYRGAVKVYNGLDDSSCSIGKWATARVNMFLRLKRGDKMEFSASKNIIDGETHQIDISDCWTPSALDLKDSESQMSQYKIDASFDFKNIDNLYLEDYNIIYFEY